MGEEHEYCPHCGEPVKGKRSQRRDTQEMVAPKCTACGVEMQSLGEQRFRLEEKSMVRAVLSPLWSLMDEPLMAFELYSCPNCRKVEWYLPARKIPPKIDLQETPRSFIKKCIKCGENIPLAQEECQYCGASQKRSRR
jgi:predicted RNA-binding Zn-ribbon protein involved in translation (DUF1610 family)